MIELSGKYNGATIRRVDDRIEVQVVTARKRGPVATLSADAADAEQMDGLARQLAEALDGPGRPDAADRYRQALRSAK